MKRMQNQRKVLSLILIAAMVLASATTAFAATDWSASSLTVAYYVTTNAATSLYSDASTTSAVKTGIAAGASIGVISSDNYFYFVLYSSYYGYVPISACNGSSAGGTGTTARTVRYSTPFYVAASTTGGYYGMFETGDVPTVISTSGDFTYVLMSGKYGYILTAALTTTSTNTTVSYYVTTSAATSLYASANTGASSYTTVPSGATIGVVSTAGSFYYATYAGYYGYVLISACQGSSGTSSVSYYVTTTQNATLYQYASTVEGSYVTIPSGTSLGVINSTGSYYRVTYSGYTGYVLASACNGSGSSTGVSYYVTTTQNTTLYQYASTTDGSYVTIPSGTSLGVIVSTGSYYRVTYSGYTGYVLMSACSSSGSGTSVSYYLTTTQSTPLYQYASTTDGTYLTVPAGASVGVISTSGSYYRVSYSGYTGYILTSACSGTSNVTTTVSYYLMTQYATPLYKEASTTSTTLATIAASRSVGVISSSYNGYYYVLVDGLYGFMPTSSFSAQTAATIGAATSPLGNVATYGTVSIGATIYASDSAKSTALGRVSNAGTVSIISQTTSGFYYVRVGNYTGYIPTASVMVASDATVIPFSDETTISVGNGVTVKKNGTVENCQSWVSLRESASSSSARVAKVSKGSTVTILETSGSYTKVNFAGTTGYILSSYIA